MCKYRLLDCFCVKSIQIYISFKMKNKGWEVTLYNKIFFIPSVFFYVDTFL